MCFINDGRVSWEYPSEIYNIGDYDNYEELQFFDGQKA